MPYPVSIACAPAVALLLLPSLSVSQPASWRPRIASGDMLYSPSDVLTPSDSMPMIGNGWMASQLKSDSIYLSGLFNGYLTVGPSHRARIPATDAMPPPGEVVDAALDVRNATYYRRSKLNPSPPGACDLNSNTTCSNAASPVWLEQRWYAHRSLGSVLVMEVQLLTADEVQVDYGVQAQVQSTSSEPLAMLYLPNAPGAPSSDIDFIPIPMPADSPFQVVNGSTLVPETNSSGLQAVAVAVTTWSRDMLPIWAAGVTYVHLTIIRSSVETPVSDLIPALTADYAVAVEYAANGTLHSSHVAEWEETVWSSGYETDRYDVALAVNSSIYAIVSSVRSDRPYGIGPGGLTAGYNGHQFWDCEIWMAPGINLLLPDLAASFITYRSLRIPGAIQKASTYTPPYSGTMFPWESALTGEETCPSWAPTGLREVHISGDIAVSVWAHWRTMQDNGNAWLNTTAFPLLSGIADFWVSKALIDTPGAVVPGWNASSSGVVRCSECVDGVSSVVGRMLDPGNGPLHICDVIPPDEYADHVNDSVYTNAVAILSLQHAVQAAQLLNMPPAVYAGWLNASTRIVMLLNTTTPGLPGGWHPEYDGYNNDTIKQADAILLGFPLDVASSSPPFGNESTTVYNNDLEWYARVTDPGGPAMTWGMFCIGHIVAGDLNAAEQFFNASFANAQAPFDVWTETPTGGTPNFLTGAGGFLQVPLFGYPQLRVNDTGIKMQPALLPGATMAKLRGVAYMGQRMNIFYNATTLCVTLQSTIDTVVQPTRVYAALPPAPATYDLKHSVAPRTPLSARSQVGQVVIDGYRVAPRNLVLIDASGASHSLSTASTCVPVQRVFITTA